MADPTFIATDIGRVLTLMASHLAEAMSLDPTRVIITALDFDDTPHYGAEQDILIGVSSEWPGVPREGGGRYVNERGRTFQVVVRTRYLMDTPQQDRLRLLRASVGHFAMEDRVSDALESLIITDENDNALTLPLLMGEWSKPKRSGRGDSKDSSGWMVSYNNVKARYYRLLDLPGP
jgi:hypothetical protein